MNKKWENLSRGPHFCVHFSTLPDYIYLYIYIHTESEEHFFLQLNF